MSKRTRPYDARKKRRRLADLRQKMKVEAGTFRMTGTYIPNAYHGGRVEVFPIEQTP